MPDAEMRWNMDHSMADRKTALITGASSGIGLAFTRKCAEEGYHLILTASQEERLQWEKEALLRWKPELVVDIYAEDLAQPGSAERLYGRIVADGQRIDLLVNNAGFGMTGAAHTLGMEREREMLQLLVVTSTELCKLFLPGMYARRAGIILNVASVGAFQPGPYTASYYAAKSYLYQYSRAIRLEAAKQGVQVNTLCPGTTKTRFFQREGKQTPIWAMPPKRVVEIAWRGLERNDAVIVPGLLNQLIRFLPSAWKARGVALLKK